MLKINGKRFLVTGGAGFIGSHIIEELLRQGKEVICIDNFVSGKQDNIFDFRASNKFRLVTADILDLDKILPHFEGVDVVFHNAASKCTVCRDRPILDLAVNAQGAWNVFEASRVHGVKKVIHASTGSVYGEAVQAQDEHHPFAPVSFYGVSKLAGERYLEAFRQYYKLRYSIIRYFHVYGPRQDASERGGVIPIFITRAITNKPLYIFGNGGQIRHFTYVKDNVDANFALANTTKSDGLAYNSAHTIKVTILELAERIISMTRSRSKIKFWPVRKGDIRHFDVKNDRIKSLGITFTNFEEGLQNTIDWYKENLTAW